MSKTFWAVIAIIVIVFGGIIIFNNHKSGSSSSNAKPTNHVEGSTKTGVTLVEYGDYECPYCGAYHPTVKQVATKYADRIQFQFRNLPLLQVHQNALSSAKAAEAAGLQGKFWQMHDMLYESQSSWSSSSNAASIFEQYAAQLSLNVAQFKQDYASDAVNNTITADINAFLKTGNEESTPTFFLDGKKVQPANTVTSFSSLIDAEIAKKAKTTSQSTSSTN